MAWAWFVKPEEHLMAVGVKYAKKGQFDRAIAKFDEAIDLNSQRPGFFADRGRAHIMNGQLNRAIADFDEAITLDPNFAAHFYLRGARGTRPI